MIMNKICGKKTDFAYIREDASRLIVGYELKRLEGENPHDLYEWYEIYFYKKQMTAWGLDAVKQAIINDIDAQTDAKILNGYQFTPDGAEEPITVWLSEENQRNFSEAQRLQIIPVKFKLNETEDKQPIYHTFETFEELDRFYKGGVQYINQCLQEGWQRKDSVDFTPYEEILNPVTE